jgi:hypothetical protein
LETRIDRFGVCTKSRRWASIKSAPRITLLEKDFTTIKS